MGEHERIILGACIIFVGLTPQALTHLMEVLAKVNGARWSGSLKVNEEVRV